MKTWKTVINFPELTSKSIPKSRSYDSASSSLSPLLGHWKLNTHRHPVIYIIPYIPGQPTAGGKATLSDADFKTVF